MRLSNTDKEAIVSCFNQRLQGSEAKLYLFGSRTDDQKKGGDIDLLVLVSNENLVQEIKAKKAKLIYDIQGLIGEQHIDLTVSTFEKSENDVFLGEVLPTAVLLQDWS